MQMSHGTHQVGYLELFAAITVAKESLPLGPRMEIQKALVRAGKAHVYTLKRALFTIKRALYTGRVYVGLFGRHVGLFLEYVGLF